MVNDYWKTSVVASSFEASILLLYLQGFNVILPHGIVLLNSVVDYRTTFFEPIPAGRRGLFSKAGYEELVQTGFIALEKGFKMRAEMVVKLRIYVLMPSSRL